MADKDLICMARKIVWPVKKNSKKIDVSAYNDSNVLTLREDVASATSATKKTKNPPSSSIMVQNMLELYPRKVQPMVGVS